MAEVNYVYATIPARYVCLYHKLLVLLAEFGVDMLKDCAATCKGNNKTVVNCFNMFNAAVAAYQLGRTKDAEVLAKYINSQINAIFRARGHECPKGEFKIAASEDGSKTAYVTCNGDNATFRVEDTTKVNCVAKSGVLDIELTDEDFGN